MKKLFALVVASFLAVAFATPALAQCSYEEGKWDCVQNDGDRNAPASKSDRPDRPEKEAPEGDKDKGHGNDEDGHDEDNPGKGKGNGPKK